MISTGSAYELLKWLLELMYLVFNLPCRGEKAFCSSQCRSAEIMIDEEMEKPMNTTAPGDSSDSYNGDGNVFETDLEETK